MALQVHFNKDFMSIYFSSLVFEPTSFQLMSSYLGFTYLALAPLLLITLTTLVAPAHCPVLSGALNCLNDYKQQPSEPVHPIQ